MFEETLHNVIVVKGYSGPGLYYALAISHAATYFICHLQHKTLETTRLFAGKLESVRVYSYEMVYMCTSVIPLASRGIIAEKESFQKLFKD